jgi:lysozyme family protein
MGQFNVSGRQMTKAFLSAWRKTGRDEGGYVNHPKDPGKATKYGITEQVARAHGYKGDMRDLPQSRAREIGKAQYWDLMALDDVAALSQPIAEEMFDSGFLSGQATVVQWLQRCLNVANREQLDYPDIRVDGLMGKITLASLSAFLKERGSSGEVAILNALNGLQSAHFTELAERRETAESFWFGWQSKRVTYGGPSK